jgi:hypothetical protein
MVGTYCFSTCTPVDDGGTFNCVGGAGSDSPARNVDELLCRLNLAYSADNEAFPQSNPYAIHLINAAWRGLYSYPGATRDTDSGPAGTGLIDKIDAPGHDASDEPGDIDANTWKHTEEFAADQSNGFSFLGIRDYPPVYGVNSRKSPAQMDWYPEYAGADGPIPITCRSTRSGVNLPAELTYHKIRIVLVMYVERELETGFYRVYADVDVLLAMRVRLGYTGRTTTPGPTKVPGRPRPGPQSDEAWRRSHMLNPDDPFDLRLQDPNSTGEHPTDTLIAYGPNGETVPRYMPWTGCRSTREYSRTVFDNYETSSGEDDEHAYIQGRPAFVCPDTGDITEPCPGAASSGCDPAYRMIDKTVIYGALTDCTELDQTNGEVSLKPQWYINAAADGTPLAGYVALGVADVQDGGRSSIASIPRKPGHWADKHWKPEHWLPGHWF